MKTDAAIAAIGHAYGQGHQFFGLAPIASSFMTLADSKPKPFITAARLHANPAGFWKCFGSIQGNP